jgi:hypothetical protein
MKEPKKITNDDLMEIYKTQKERMKFLSKKYGSKEQKSNKILERIKKVGEIPPSEGFIEAIKSQSWYQVECIRCGISNRKWLEEGNCAYDYPIRMEKIETKSRIKIFYFCDNCKCGWEG